VNVNVHVHDISDTITNEKPLPGITGAFNRRYNEERMAVIQLETIMPQCSITSREK
jgi:hypothetical protein